jgi:hypothetical protein
MDSDVSHTGLSGLFLSASKEIPPCPAYKNVTDFIMTEKTRLITNIKIPLAPGTWDHVQTVKQGKSDILSW